MFMQTTNLAERAFDGVLDVYEQLGSQMLPLCQYTRLFTLLPESTACLVFIYRDVLAYHRVAYQLFSLQPSRETNLRMLTRMKELTPFFSVAETVQSHLGGTEPYIRAPSQLTGKTSPVHSNTWIIPSKSSCWSRLRRRSSTPGTCHGRYQYSA